MQERVSDATEHQEGDKASRLRGRDRLKYPTERIRLAYVVCWRVGMGDKVIRNEFMNSPDRRQWKGKFRSG
jgi:hypothetical protein